MRSQPGRISLSTARQLLDFRGSGASPISEFAAEEQLKGAVALHNILQSGRFAYLADEVGMGKTYVALGTLALFRHFNPSFRALIIAPRENIQKKWLKELKNFTARNVRFSDLRVKAAHGAPATPTVVCQNLAELVREAAVDADRDFFMRLTSFSFALGGDSSGWKSKRDDLRRYLPWLDADVFELRDKNLFKDNFARAVNCGLPEFDLVIVDEGHNLKGGLGSGTSRNRVLSLAFGHPNECVLRNSSFPGYGPRAKRLLFLSATPLENDYIQLWNQLDVFGFGGEAVLLRDPDLSNEEKQAFAQRFLVRRVTSLPVAGKTFTKNLYRRQWRQGGVSAHDEPLTVPDERQRLSVALVQKKVSEAIGGAKFNNCFQIGMLASFESFLETARAIPKDSSHEAPSNFDESDQTDDAAEKLGIDVGAVNQLARSYRRTFDSELPHPKMDAVVERLAAAFASGEKALVFVRRVASVRELQRKLEERYDEYLFTRLRAELKSELHHDLSRIIRQYRAERSRGVDNRRRMSFMADEIDDEDLVEDAALQDAGGVESFFAWFFRGEGPEGPSLSGATLQRRFSQAGSVHSTFFEDNHVADILGVQPGEVLKALSTYLARDTSELSADLRRLAGARLPRVRKQQRRNIFRAYQAAALEMITSSPGELREYAQIVYDERYAGTAILARDSATAPPVEAWFEVETFWTKLRARSSLRDALWPTPPAPSIRDRFRQSEMRRELLSAMTRFGHPFIDLYVLSVNRLGRLRLRQREQDLDEGVDLADEFLDLLERQAAADGPTIYSAYRELSDAAAHFDLILSVNDPEARSASLSTMSTRFGRLLRAQQPVGGMWGQVNETLVRQFRMPGYPLVLITTDLLREGEDLHTFCSSVHHYGISWMPSSMEQRVGRIDRVSSQTDRRLTALPCMPAGGDLLQVYYPHLRDTVEVVQVGVVLDRLDSFTRLMHQQLIRDPFHGSGVDLRKDILRIDHAEEASREPLKTAFPIRTGMLEGATRRLLVAPREAEALRARFHSLPQKELGTNAIGWEGRAGENALFGTMQLRTRCQPFTLLLRSVGGRPVVRCLSPIGVVEEGAHVENYIRAAIVGSGMRACDVYDDQFDRYTITIEGDVLLGREVDDASRIGWLLRNATDVADRLEESLLQCDEPMPVFKSDFDKEALYER